jgi:predicted phage-related endonuclease
VIAGNANLVPIDLDAEDDRNAWVAARMAGIGGSDAAAVLGEDQYKGPIDVWQERVMGGAAAFSDNVRTIGGRWLEPKVLDAFGRGGAEWPRPGDSLVIIKPPTVYHRDRPWQRGSADGLACDPDVLRASYPTLSMVGGLQGGQLALAFVRLKPAALVEAKTHGWFGSRGYDLNDDGNAVISVPPAKRIQCAWYMALYDVDLCYLAALVDTHHRKTFVLPRDRELESMMLEEVERFWTRHVLTGDPPPVDGTSRYTAYLRERYRKHGAEMVGTTEQVDLATETLQAIKGDMKRLKADAELAQQVIKNHIGEHAGAVTSHGAVTWKSQASGKLRDKDARDALYLALGWTDAEILEFEERYKQPDHRVLRLPKVK